MEVAREEKLICETSDIVLPIACPCVFKFIKLNVQMRPVFADSVTNYINCGPHSNSHMMQ